MTEPVYLASAVRTPVAPRNGAFRDVPLHVLGAASARECLVRSGISLESVDEIIVGNALGAGGNPARLIALEIGLPKRVGGLTVDRQCCGGLDALVLAAGLIKSGYAKAVLAGGAESYSRRPKRYRVRREDGELEPYDQAAFTPWPDRDPLMGEAAAALAQELRISRDEQDIWAVDSHRKAVNAKKRLANEMTPVPGVALGFDSCTRNLTDKLCQRARVISGTVTHANTSVAADASAFFLVVSERVARCLKCKKIRFAAGTTVGGEPEKPGLAPVIAISEVLEREGVRAARLAVAEIMEAYAVQAIACTRKSEIDPAVVNPGGGSLARGHPIGASGAILAVRTYHELAHRGSFGLAAIAAAGGLGTAVLFEA